MWIRWWKVLLDNMLRLRRFSVLKPLHQSRLCSTSDTLRGWVQFQGLCLLTRFQLLHVKPEINKSICSTELKPLQSDTKAFPDFLREESNNFLLCKHWGSDSSAVKEPTSGQESPNKLSPCNRNMQVFCPRLSMKRTSQPTLNQHPTNTHTRLCKPSLTSWQGPRRCSWGCEVTAAALQPTKRSWASSWKAAMARLHQQERRVHISAGPNKSAGSMQQAIRLGRGRKRKGTCDSTIYAPAIKKKKGIFFFLSFFCLLCTVTFMLYNRQNWKYWGRMTKQTALFLRWLLLQKMLYYLESGELADCFDADESPSDELRVSLQCGNL